MLVNCLIHFSGLLETCISNSEFVRLFFEKPIEGSSIIYTNYFWLFTNRNIHQI